MKHIVAVASGKGGVGKSTVAANLAVALANYPLAGNLQPLRVALIDVDFYGPSIPTLMGATSGMATDHEGKLVPANRYNVKYVSIAFFLKNPDDPIVWRGPMFGKAISQLFTDVNWGEVDVCVVDMPPGTGDAQLSLSQLVKLSGAVMVTTPQEVALSDVRRAINMFGKVNVPVLGLVENMAGLVLPNGEKINLFGEGGGAELSKNYKLDLLGSIPIEIKIREGGDKGEPIALEGGSSAGKLYQEIASNLLEKLSQLEKSEPELKIIN